MSVDPPQSLPPDPPPFPRLCIRDWFVGTLVCGCLFMFSRRPDFWSLRPPAILFASAAVASAEVVVAVTMLALLIARRSAAGFRAGHWLCLYALVDTLFVRVFDPLQPGLFLAPETSVWLAQVKTAAIVAVLIPPAWFVELPQLWRLYFRCSFGGHLAYLLLSAIATTEPSRLQPWIDRAYVLLIWTGIALFWTAIVVELVRHRRQDWAHWVGVFAPILLWILWAAEWIMIRPA